MLRGLALLALTGCFFDADYRGGQFTCSDNICPTGLTCENAVCVTPPMVRDAAIDTAVMDAMPRAAVCSDPQPFPSTGGMTAGTTAGRSNTVTSTCNGSVQNGSDAVYKIDATTGPILVSVTGSFAVTAYALVTTCATTPATPMCVSNITAVPGNPLSIPAGTYWIVVDSANAAAAGTYTLKLEVQ